MDCVYMHSANLDLDIKYLSDRNLIVINDKNCLNKNIIYSTDELDLLENEGFEVTKKIYSIKKLFAGTIIDYEVKNE